MLTLAGGDPTDNNPGLPPVDGYVCMLQVQERQVADGPTSQVRHVAVHCRQSVGVAADGDYDWDRNISPKDGWIPYSVI